MSGPRGRIFVSHRIITKALIGILASLIVVGSICALLTFPRALAAPIVSDNFNDNSIDTAKWNPNDLFSGFTNTNVPIAETSQRLEIGPLLQNVSGSSYRGMRTVNTYDFTDDYAFVELVQAAASNTGADTMFTVGPEVNNYYRMGVTAGSLWGQRKLAGTKTTLFSIPYDTTNHRFLRIRHTASGAVTLDTAPGSSGVPGTWTQRYSEAWNSSISRTATYFEIKGGTSQVEANPPGKVIFDNFEVASNTAPEVISISPTSGPTSGGTSVTISGTGFSTGATVTLGGTAATNVTVVSSVSITATTPAHTAGTVDVVVTNSDGQNDTLSNGFTYTSSETNQISNINVAVNCNTSALINFRTSAASRAFIEYGPTTSYGSSTIDDPVRFYTEHAIQLTGLTANTTYHFRVNANSNGLTQSSDQSFTTASSGAFCTALPVQVDSRMPDMTGAVEKTVKASGGHYTPAQFQNALNDAGTASEKRIITVDAGLTLSGQWSLPANADQNWIVIRTSEHAQLPEGKRVVPADASKLFKIQNTSVDPTLVAAAAANHIRIIGAEITIDPLALADAPGGANQSGLIALSTNLANNASQYPEVYWI
jgi:IPT/TIG domain